MVEPGNVVFCVWVLDVEEEGMLSLAPEAVGACLVAADRRVTPAFMLA